MSPVSYVTVMPASNNRSGSMVAARQGDVVTYTRLEAREPEAMRAEAQRMYPHLTVWMPGDKIKPWEA